MGGLLQIAELAWQAQHDASLYAASDYALAASMELHARIIRAGGVAGAPRNASLLPPGFAFAEDMPRPPPGAVWRFNVRTQGWAAFDATTQAPLGIVLDDGVKYLVRTYCQLGGSDRALTAPKLGSMTLSICHTRLP